MSSLTRMIAIWLVVIPSIGGQGRGHRNAFPDLRDLPSETGPALWLMATRSSPNPEVEMAISPGLFLRDGSRVGGQVLEVNDTFIVYRNREGIETKRAQRFFSFIVWQTVPKKHLRTLLGHGEGVLFSNGDFMEGKVLEYQEGRMRVSSVLHGMKQFTIPGNVLAVVLHPLDETP